MIDGEPTNRVVSKRQRQAGVESPQVDTSENNDTRTRHQVLMQRGTNISDSRASMDQGRAFGIQMREDADRPKQGLRRTDMYAVSNAGMVQERSGGSEALEDAYANANGEEGYVHVGGVEPIARS